MLFPQPRNLVLGEGTYRVKGDYSSCDLVSFYNAVKGGCEDVSVSRSPLAGKEEYRLVIDGSGAHLTAACDEGLFRAATSLWQLVRTGGGSLQHMQIDDQPQIARRGYMLDISRGRMPRVETIKTMIDFLASLKYNEFQLYMEGDCFKYAAYPEETAGFDCLTPEGALHRPCAQSEFLRPHVYMAEEAQLPPPRPL